MSKIQIMGILNVTPDSFFDGQGDQYMDNVDEYTRKLSQDLCKADIIDIGAESTRPGSLRISVKDFCLVLLPKKFIAKSSLSILLFYQNFKSTKLFRN